jgi:hypothetical protein
VASLLAEFLHDAARRAAEISTELADLQGKVPYAVEAYRARMHGMADRARMLVDGMLGDPDLEDPRYGTNYFRDYRQVARLVQALENLPVLVLRRFSGPDLAVTALMRAICTEIGYPFTAPICSSISSQYYWTMPDMDLVFVPCLEPDHLLGLADIYHELGHIVLFRERLRLEYPALAMVDRCYDQIIAKAQSGNWPQQSIAEIEQFGHRWRQSWLLEFSSDLIATYLVGPAFGWCNIRTSTNLGGDLFGGNESHPADDARAEAIAMMLEYTGDTESAGTIRGRWAELIRLSNESKPPRYELAYPTDLVRELTRFIGAGCQALGLKAWSTSSQDTAPVTYAVNEAWREFREQPATFGEYEQESLRKILALVRGSAGGIVT